MVITIEREGTFPVGWTKDRSRQCGMRGTEVLHFRVKVQGGAEDLNRHGWLLDNQDIPAYFRGKFRRVGVFKSCEEIAQEACRDFEEVCRRSGSRARYVRVSVSGIPGSWITAELGKPLN